MSAALPTKPIRAVLIDDEPDALATLCALLRRVADVEVLAEADDVQSGIEAIRRCRPNLVFLDVQMHDGTGFDLLENFSTETQQPDFQVIFCTGHDRYAVRAFRFHALDYLLKPLDPDDLDSALDRAREALACPKFGPEKTPGFPPGQKIFLPMPSGHWVVPLDDIRRIESDGAYSTLHLRDGRRSTQARTLGLYESGLPAEQFFRAHQSHLVHRASIAEVDRHFEWILLDDGFRVPLARRRKAEFEAFLRGAAQSH